MFLHLVLLVAVQNLVSYGLLNNSIPRFSNHSQLTPVVNLYFSQISSEAIIIIITTTTYCN